MEGKRFPNEFINQFNRCFELLSKSNIHFFKKETSNLRKYWRFLYLVPLIGLLNTSMIGFITKINSETDGVFKLAYMVSVCLISLQAVLKAIIILHKRADIEELVSNLGDIWKTSNFTDKQQVKKTRLMKRLTWSTSIYYWTNILGAWLHLFAPLIVVLVRRIILKQDCELKLPFGGIYWYEPTESWLKYLLTYAFQTLTLLSEIYVYIGSEFLVITLCGNLVMHFTMLREDLENLSPTIKTGGVYSLWSRESHFTALEKHTIISIQDFIPRHQKLIKLAQQLDDIFNVMVFINLIFVNFNLCFFGFTAVVAQGGAETAHNSVGVIALLLPIYIFCYYGELLKEESQGIADSAYFNQWYKGDVKYQKIIMFIILRSQRPCYMTAMKHVPITLNTFTKVLSTTWSYFSLLTSVYLND